MSQGPARRRALLAALGLVAGLAAPAAAQIRGSALALPLLAGRERPQAVLAQRAIVRSWGPDYEDSTYVTVDVPGWRSEGWAAVLSAAVPGAGQAYVGEGGALWFVLAEAGGWVANRIWIHSAQDRRDRSETFAGAPTDSVSAWSFARWRAATGGSSADLERIYALDHEAFYDLIGTDPRFLAGWGGNAAATRTAYYALRGKSRDYYDRAALAARLLWLNHLVSAVGALRAARDHNLPLRQNLELKLRSSWRGASPAVVAALERRF